MGYLLTKLLLFALAAFAIGLVVGWVTCNEADDGQV